MAQPNMTHSDGVADDGGLTAETFVDIGTVTLPKPGPWSIWGLWFQVVESTPTTAEESIHVIRVTAPGGDVTPTPQPFDFAALNISAIAGDGQVGFAMPWEMKRVNWTAAGGAQLTFASAPDITVTGAPRVAVGVFYGTRPPLEDYVLGVPMMHGQRVTGTADGTTETSLGTITLSESARMITGLCVTVDHATGVEAEEIIGTFRIQSDDVDLAPNIYPFSHAASANLDPAEAIMMFQPYVPKYVPVRIPVTGGSRIQFLTTLDVDVTTAANANAYATYV